MHIIRYTKRTPHTTKRMVDEASTKEFLREKRSTDGYSNGKNEFSERKTGGYNNNKHQQQPQVCYTTK